MPPRKRNVMKRIQIEVDAQPMADSKYRIAIVISTFLRPYFFAGGAAIIEPSTVPIKLEATVKPCQNDPSCHNSWIVFSAPEMTAVSKPNKKPPNAAIRAIRTGYESMLVGYLLKFIR